jgi:hypothetical protein
MEQVIADVNAILGRADDDAGERIFHGCRDNSPDISLDEMQELIRENAPKARGNSRNPTGVFIDSVVKSSRPESLVRRRRKRQAKIEAAEASERARQEQIALVQQEAEERLKTLSDSERQTLYDEERSKLFSLYPRADGWAPEVLQKRLDASVRRRLGGVY